MGRVNEQAKIRQKCDQVDENIASKHSKNNKNKYNENNFRCGFFDNKGE